MSKKFYDSFLKHRWVVLFILLAFTEPDYLSQNGLVNNIYRVAKLASVGIVMLTYIKRGMISNFIIIISLYEILLLIVTFVNEGDYKGFALKMLMLISFSMLTEMQVEDDFVSFVNMLYWILWFYLLINTISIYVYPEGIYSFRVGINDSFTSNTNWFLGYKNNIVLTIIPAFVLGAVRDYGRDKISLSYVFMIFFGVYNIYVTWSATAVLGVLLFLLLFCLLKIGLLPSMANARNYLLVNLCIFPLLVVFRVQELFAGIIESVLHKDATLTGRTVIWDWAMHWIGKSPIWGFGIEDSKLLMYKLHGDFAVHAHNYYLDVIYKGGILGAIIILLLWFICVRQSELYNTHVVIRVIAIGFVCFLFMFQDEVWPNMLELYFMIMIFMYESGTIVKQIEESRNSRRDMGYEKKFNKKLRL